jgi:hypothetical protein
LRQDGAGTFTHVTAHLALPASVAAARAEAMMLTLAPASGMPEWVHRLTQFGERRIDGCQKYGLGAGYRLVYGKGEGQDVFLCVGAHNDCAR